MSFHFLSWRLFFYVWFWTEYFKNLLIRSQDLKEKYYDAGLFYVFTSKCFKKFDEITVTKNFFGFEISINKAVDIDTMEDWNLAELIYKGTKLIKN